MLHLLLRADDNEKQWLSKVSGEGLSKPYLENDPETFSTQGRYCATELLSFSLILGFQMSGLSQPSWSCLGQNLRLSAYNMSVFMCVILLYPVKQTSSNLALRMF